MLMSADSLLRLIGADTSNPAGMRVFGRISDEILPMKEKRFSVEQIVGILRQRRSGLDGRPGYPGALQTLCTTGAHIVPVLVDEDRLIVQVGRELAPKAKLAFVTPANQFPARTRSRDCGFF
jgi:hypothetical protein